MRLIFHGFHPTQTKKEAPQRYLFSWNLLGGAVRTSHNLQGIQSDHFLVTTLVTTKNLVA